MLSQKSIVQGFVSAHWSGVPARQAPDTQRSAPLQALPSLHCASLLQGNCAMADVADSSVQVTRTPSVRTSPPLGCPLGLERTRDAKHDACHEERPWRALPAPPRVAWPRALAPAQRTLRLSGPMAARRGRRLSRSRGGKHASCQPTRVPGHCLAPGRDRIPPGFAHAGRWARGAPTVPRRIRW
jgi:hypothetical protein